MTGRSAAAEARAEFGLDSMSPVADVLRLVERRSDLAVFVLPLDRNGVDGLVREEAGTHFILINSERVDNRKRFTLAHEVGHVLLGHGTRLDKRIDLATEDRDEIDANEFAACFLLPEEGVERWLFGTRELNPLQVTVVIAAHFNVSEWAAVYRLQNLKAFTAEEADAVRTRLRQKQHRTAADELQVERTTDLIAEIGWGGRHVPADMSEAVLSLLERGLLSPAAAAARLRLEPEKADEFIAEHGTVSMP